MLVISDETEKIRFIKNIRSFPLSLKSFRHFIHWFEYSRRRSSFSFFQKYYISRGHRLRPCQVICFMLRRRLGSSERALGKTVGDLENRSDGLIGRGRCICKEDLSWYLCPHLQSVSGPTHLQSMPSGFTHDTNNRFFSLFGITSFLYFWEEGIFP